MFRLKKTIDHHFPDLYEKIETIPECRQRSDYNLLELIMAGIAMFLFKQGSRNALNNERNEPKFRKNYERLFEARLPHMDTVEEVMRVLEEHHIDTLKTELTKGLLAKKIFRAYRVFGHTYQVVIDGTHVMDVPEGHCPHCLHQTFKNGKTRYFHNVVEAKLIGDNGFCVSLATVWSGNPEESISRIVNSKPSSGWPRSSSGPIRVCRSVSWWMVCIPIRPFLGSTSNACFRQCKIMNSGNIKL